MKQSHEHTLVEDYPILIKIFGSPHPIFNLIAVVPLGVYFGLNISASLWLAPILLLGSWLYWTFFEYAMHRWIYHGRYKNKFVREFVYSFHIYHHNNIEDPRVITAGPLMVIFFTFLLILPLFLIFPGAQGELSLFGFLVLVNYYFYEWIHHLIHKSKVNNFYMRFIRSYHMHHHERNWRSNFGNTTSLWDHLLGTHEEPQGPPVSLPNGILELIFEHGTPKN